jgi:hypothetical protein
MQQHGSMMMMMMERDQIEDRRWRRGGYLPGNMQVAVPVRKGMSKKLVRGHRTRIHAICATLKP